MTERTEGREQLTEAEQAARKLELEALCDKLIAEGRIAVEHVTSDVLDAEGKPKLATKYIIARFTEDKCEAAEMCQRFDLAHHFDRIKQLCFVNGMVDAIRTYQREIKKLGALKMEKAVEIGHQLVAHITNERKKI